MVAVAANDEIVQVVNKVHIFPLSSKQPLYTEISCET